MSNRPPIRVLRWAPPRLPMRGAALLIGPAVCEVEVEPDTGRPAWAYVGIRLRRRFWYLELVPGLRLSHCP